MPLYEIVFVMAVVLFAALSFMQVIMRQQVHQARFGNQEISPWDGRFSNNLLGQYGIWKLHKRAYERSPSSVLVRGRFRCVACVYSRGSWRFSLRSLRTLIHCY